MKNQKKIVSGSDIPRRKAEKSVKNKQLDYKPELLEKETLQLIHELQAHQVELELQIEELRKAGTKEQLTSRRYIELYDCAPTGYFILSKIGEIVEINLSGAELLGNNRSELIKSNFEQFVSSTDKPVFHLFLQKIINDKIKQTCEVILSADENLPVTVYLSGNPYNNGEQCIITAVDISEKKQFEDALKVSEANKRNFILQTAMDGFWLIDLQGKLLEVNETYCSMSGYSEQELLTMYISDLEYMETKNETIAHIQKTKNKGEDRFETRHRRKDGTILDVEINVHYQQVNGGRFVAFLRDITTRKQKEEENRQSEERYKSLFQKSKIASLLIDPENGEIIDANAAALKFYGWSHAEIRSKKIFDLNTLSQDTVAVEMQKAKHENRNHFQFKHRLANGLIRDVEVYSGPINFNNKEFIYSVIVDISDRLRIENALYESELKLRKFIDYAPHGVFVANELGEYIDVNFSACTITGYSKEELLSMKITDLVPQESMGDALVHFTKLSKDGFAKGDFPLLKKDKSIGYWSVDAVKLSDNLLLGFVVDITEQKLAQEILKQSEESKRIQLQTILLPEGSIADLELNDIIDAPSIQILMESFFELAQIPMAIIDKKGKILVGVGWQDICTKFHRVHPKACRNCFESDVHLTHGIPDGEFMLYKCKNNMWDMATPIIIGGEHKGNLYMGQFFFDDQPVDLDIFRKQATEYSFDEREYLDALARVPRLNKSKLDYAKEFFLNFALSISQLSYSNIKLARAIEQQKNNEFALRASETRFKNLIWNLQVGVLLHGPKGEILMSNPKALEILGYSEEQLMGSHLFNSDWNMINDDGLPFPQAEQPLFRVIDTRMAVRDIVAGVYNPVKNQIVWLLIHAVPQLNTDGTVQQIVSTFIDITNLKNAETELINSEQRLRFHFENSPLGVVEWNSDFIVTQWSKEAENLFGWQKDEIIGRPLNSLNMIFEDDAPEVSKTIETLQGGKQKMVVKTNRNYTKEGKVIECTWYNSVLTKKNGEINSILSLVQDITQRKKAENDLLKLNEELENRVDDRTKELLKSNEEIKQAEEKYRTIANYTYAWESWIDPKGKFIYVSPSCLRITGFTVEDFMNDSHLFFKIAHPEDRDFVEKYFYEGISGNFPSISFDFRIITRGGEIKWVAHSCSTVFGNTGTWLGMRCSNNDITERKNVENFLVNSQDKLRALTQHMNELAENERKTIAREIHDELGHMLTALKYDIDSLMSNSEMTVDLVKDELPPMFSMVESLIESVRKIATDLRPGILDHLGLLPALEWQINQFRMMTKMNCIYAVPDDLDVTFTKHETTNIFRMVQEMLTNAARHSKASKVEISARMENKTFVLHVKDNGVGFMMADKIQSGSLGLMGMNERALSIGAKIQIDSIPEKGTSITFLLDKI